MSTSKGHYSDLQVMKSAAGYYVGSTFTYGPESDTPGLVVPGSRDSTYFDTSERAQEYLNYVNS